MPIQPPCLIELLFGAYRRRVLRLLLLHPEQSFNAREIMRLAGVRAGSLHRERTALATAGLLTRRVSRSQVRYQAVHDCPLAESFEQDPEGEEVGRPDHGRRRNRGVCNSIACGQPEPRPV
jgi:hypothetical protein